MQPVDEKGLRVWSQPKTYLPVYQSAPQVTSLNTLLGYESSGGFPSGSFCAEFPSPGRRGKIPFIDNQSLQLSLKPVHRGEKKTFKCFQHQMLSQACFKMFSPPFFSFYSQFSSDFYFSFMRHQYSWLEDCVPHGKGEEMRLMSWKGHICEDETMEGFALLARN